MIVIFLALLGLNKGSKKLIYSALFLLYTLATPIFSNTFFSLLEKHEYKKDLSTLDTADAIVVLGGWLTIYEHQKKEYVEWGDPDRFFNGIELMKSDKAPKLIFTGTKMPWGNTERTEGDILKDYAVQYGIPNSQIFVSNLVTKTEEEASEVKNMNIANNIILVTSAFHMHRARRLFENEGFQVIPYPVDFKTKTNDSLTFMSFLPNAGSLAKTEKGMREMIGRIYYFFKYYQK